MKNILKLNWFNWDKEMNWWIRSDGFMITKYNDYHIVDSEWNVKYCLNENEIIGYLALNWIINRLF